MRFSLLFGWVFLAACAPKSTDFGVDARPTSPDGSVHTPGALGAWQDETGALEVRVRSRRATRLEVWLYRAPRGEGPALTFALERQVGRDTWATRAPAEALRGAGLTGTLYYGYRAWGPNWPHVAEWQPGGLDGFVADVDAEGNRFNPNKLLIDPYAKELSHDPIGPHHRDHSIYEAGANRARDSGPVAPKGIVLPARTFDVGVPPARALKDDVLYEVHVRGLTRGDPSLGDCRGTYRAAGEKAQYLQALGITAVELLPLHETPNDANDLEPNAAFDNYWGYNTLNFFAPDRRYACDQSPGGPTREVAEMVRAFHAEGIKVLIDVVYNHTSESGNGAILSLRGLDNASYYELAKDKQGYADHTGIGANTNAADSFVRDLALDSLKYWHQVLGVDGFRFDLATVLANACREDCFDYDPDDAAGILKRAVIELQGAALIAEPWGIGEGTYQLGRFPPGWSEWNDRFRDRVRRVQNRQGKEDVAPGALATDLAGASDLFGDRAPWASIHYVVAHDGFTLHDLYACNEKQNQQAWPAGPSPGGSDNNLSWDQGGDPARQREAARVGLALTVLSAGVPMFNGGDEMLRSQRCNNNPYNLDTEVSWLDWTRAESQAAFVAFTRKLLSLRHGYSALRPAKHWRGIDANGNGLKDLSWHTPSGAEADARYMEDARAHFLAWRIDASEAGDPARSLYIAYNWDAAPRDVQLPPAGVGLSWHRALDTAAAHEEAHNAWSEADQLALVDGRYRMAARTLTVFVER